MKKFLFAVIFLLLIASVFPESVNAGPLCDSVGGSCSLICGPNGYDNSDYDDCAGPARCCIPTPDDCNLAGGTCVSGGCPSDRDIGLSNCAPLQICCLDPGAGNGALCNSTGGACSLICGPGGYDDNSVNDCIGRPFVRCCLSTPDDCTAAGGTCCSSCTSIGDDIGLADCPVLQLCCLSGCTSSGGGAGDALCADNTSINTAIGCIPVANTNAFIGFLLRWGIGIAGGIAFLLILFAGFQIITSGGDPKKLQAGKELLTSAIAGLLLLIFSIFILRLVGVNILGLPEFGG